MTDWVLRPYIAATDESAVLTTWIRSYEHSRAGRAKGAHLREPVARPGMRVPKPEASREFWNEHKPLFLELMRRSDITVVCDPGRVFESDAGPPVIWAWAAFEGDVLHYLLVKRTAVKAGIAVDIVRELVGERLHKPIAYTLEPVELKLLKGLADDGLDDSGRCIPPRWYCDHTWFARNLGGLVAA